MGRHYKYRPGSFYRVSDHTGFPVRAEYTRKMWNNLIVEESTYEPRQPQDLVRGLKDQQSVPDARPLAPALFVGPVWTTTSYAVPIGSGVIPLTSLASFSIGDLVAIMTTRGGGTLHYAYVINVGLFNAPTQPLTTESGFDITTEDGLDILVENLVPAIVIGRVLKYPALSGAQVWNYGPVAGGPSSYLATEDGTLITTENGQDILL